MRINHLFVGAIEVERSTRFYCELFGFVPTTSFPAGDDDGQIIHREIYGHDLDLLILPTGTATLPYPHHVAFEADSTAEFEAILQTAKMMGLKPRSEVALDSEEGVGILTMNDKTYRIFYVLDPSRVNVEVMWRIPK